MTVGFCVACIDKRFDLLTTKYLSKTQNADQLYLGTNAGAALCLGYKRYYKNICNKCSKKKTCDPNNADMALLIIYLPLRIILFIYIKSIIIKKNVK